MTVRLTQEAQAETYRRELVGYCYRYFGSYAEAEDAVQETMLRAWQRSADSHLASRADPAEAVVLRDSVRLALIATLQLLPPRQRVVLILDIGAGRIGGITHFMGPALFAEFGLPAGRGRQEEKAREAARGS